MQPMRSIPIPAFALIACSSIWTSAAYAQLPGGSGRDTVERVCTSCHAIDTVIDVRRTRSGWQDVISDMAGRGADGTPQELAVVVSYLTKFFGKINVNNASPAELAEFLGIDEKQARAMADYRSQHGEYKNLDQLKQTPGVDADKLQQKRELIAFKD
jgi:competence ComEA-like helix-hairpin-helix protein